MQRIFEGLEFVKIFLDDILVFSRDYSEHLKHLELVLRRLRKQNISINFAKSTFGKTEVQYLGYIIDNNGIRPNCNRVVKFRENLPQVGKISSKKLKSITGFIEWFRPFIKHLSQKLEPLNKKLRNAEKITWNYDDHAIVLGILENIQEDILLSRPETTKPFRLEVDASDVAIGGILLQSGKVIGIFSKSLLLAERNYTAMEREMLSVYRSIKHFHKIVYGSKVDIYTNHANLLHDTEDMGKRINKWKILMMEYDYTLNYHKGSKNVPADFLSRIYYVGSPNKPLDLTTISRAYTPDEIKNHKGNQRNIGGHIIFMYRHERVIIPKTLKEQVIWYVHDQLNHASARGIYLAIKNYISMESMERRIEETLKGCKKCQEYKTSNSRAGEYNFIETPKHPFERISSDIYGPLNGEEYQSKEEYKKFYLLTITDHFSRLTRIFLLTFIDTQHVLTKIKNWFEKQGTPKELITDNGRQFTSKELKGYLDKKR